MESRTDDGSKVKKTRRRQRLSCVECTKRRQKCDRQIPCGLCTSRGIAHLCRWEPIVLRPTPQRPSAAARISSESAEETIRSLSARIAILEESIVRQSAKNSEQAAANSSIHVDPETLHSKDHDSEISVQSSFSSPDVASRTYKASGQSPTSAAQPAIIDYNVQTAAVALAKLSLAPREEYVGNGTILCAIHRMGNCDDWRLSFARSASAYTVASLRNRFNEHPFAEPGRAMVDNLPPRCVIEGLLEVFFVSRNWEFGLPEGYVRRCCAQTFGHLERRCPGPFCLAPTSCIGCTETINAHWLTLLFAILALAAPDGSPFFTYALAARRIAEDVVLAMPTYFASERGAVHGTVLGCIASVLLAAYLADRGRVSEAWKIVGSGMRSAQAMGLHRDPGWRMWEAMSKEEMEIRLLGWWPLWMRDRLYSFILGRPTMAPKNSFDVKLLPGPIHGDGSTNPHASFQQALIRLCDIIGDGAEGCLHFRPPSYATILDIDRRYKEWLTQLPAHLQWRRESPSSVPSAHTSSCPLSTSDIDLTRQRQTLATYYLGGLMNVHRLYLMRPPPTSSSDRGASSLPQIADNPSREASIDLAIELMRVLCTALPSPEVATSPEPCPQQTSAFLFHYVYFLFDGAVTLLGARAQTPAHPRDAECLELFERAMNILRGCVSAAEAQGERDGEGEIARRAITVLESLTSGTKRSASSRGGKEDGETTERAASMMQNDVAPSMSGSAHRVPANNGTSGFTISQSSSAYMSTIPSIAHQPLDSQLTRRFANPDPSSTDNCPHTNICPDTDNCPHPPYTSTTSSHPQGPLSFYPESGPVCSSPRILVTPHIPHPEVAIPQHAEHIHNPPYPASQGHAPTYTSGGLVSSGGVMAVTPFAMLQSGGALDAQWARLAGMDVDIDPHGWLDGGCDAFLGELLGGT